jgi:hypothetical protein
MGAKVYLSRLSMHEGSEVVNSSKQVGEPHPFAKFFSPRELKHKSVQEGLHACAAYPNLIDSMHGELQRLIESDVHEENKRWSMREVVRRTRKNPGSFVGGKEFVSISEAHSGFYARILLRLYPDIYKGRIFTRTLGPVVRKYKCPSCSHEFSVGQVDYTHKESPQADAEDYNV